MLVYFIFFFFLVWNVFMSSFLTIPLYQLMCNLSYFDSDYFFFLYLKDCNTHQFFFYDFFTFDYDISEFELKTCTILYTGFFTDFFFSNIYFYYISNSFFIYLFNQVFNTFVFVYDCTVISIKFSSSVSNFVLLEFISLQDYALIVPGESTLVFFRLYNPTSLHLCGISLYYIFPFSASVYLNKIQCFCFEFINILPFESVELPIIFFIDTSIINTLILLSNRIYLSYILFVK